VFGVHLGRLKEDIIRPQYEVLFHFYAEGYIRPYIDRTFPLADASHAHQRLQDRKNIGKVLLLP